MNKFFKNFGFWIVLIVALFIGYTLMGAGNSIESIEFSKLVSEIKSENVLTLQYEENIIKIETKDKDQYGENVIKTCYVPSLNMLYEHAGDMIKKQVSDGKLTIITPEPSSYPWWLSMLPTIILLIIMIGFALPKTSNDILTNAAPINETSKSSVVKKTSSNSLHNPYTLVKKMV